jgi:hypothetical protein
VKVSTLRKLAVRFTAMLKFVIAKQSYLKALVSARTEMTNRGDNAADSVATVPGVYGDELQKLLPQF